MYYYQSITKVTALKGYITNESDDQILANLDRMIPIVQKLLDDPSYFTRVWENGLEEVRREYENGLKALITLKQNLSS